MGETNRSLLQSHINAHLDNVIWPKIRENGREYCDKMCKEAIASRHKSPNAHDFTGNLLNSIVVAMYEDKKFIYAAFASDNGVSQPVQGQMTKKRGRYYFKIDYTGVKSSYNPEIETKEGLGSEDAKNFVSSYKPKTKAKFEIVVAYTTAYANFVEMKRNTTGILFVKAELERTASQELGKK